MAINRSSQHIDIRRADHEPIQASAASFAADDHLDATAVIASASLPEPERNVSGARRFVDDDAQLEKAALHAELNFTVTRSHARR